MGSRESILVTKASETRVRVRREDASNGEFSEEKTCALFGVAIITFPFARKTKKKE